MIAVIEEQQSGFATGCNLDVYFNTVAPVRCRARESRRCLNAIGVSSEYQCTVDEPHAAEIVAFPELPLQIKSLAWKAGDRLPM